MAAMAESPPGSDGFPPGHASGANRQCDGFAHSIGSMALSQHRRAALRIAGQGFFETLQAGKGLVAGEDGPWVDAVHVGGGAAERVA